MGEQWRRRYDGGGGGREEVWVRIGSRFCGGGGSEGGLWGLAGWRLVDNVYALVLLEAEGVASLIGVEGVILAFDDEHVPKPTVPLVQFGLQPPHNSLERGID